jgi:hypothetical protein
MAGFRLFLPSLPEHWGVFSMHLQLTMGSYFRSLRWYRMVRASGDLGPWKI